MFPFVFYRSNRYKQLETCCNFFKFNMNKINESKWWSSLWFRGGGTVTETNYSGLSILMALPYKISPHTQITPDDSAFSRTRERQRGMIVRSRDRVLFEHETCRAETQFPTHQLKPPMLESNMLSFHVWVIRPLSHTQTVTNTLSLSLTSPLPLQRGLLHTVWTLPRRPLFLSRYVFCSFPNEVCEEGAIKHVLNHVQTYYSCCL